MLYTTVRQMKSKKSGNPVNNQYIITDDVGETFQSYRTLIARKEYEGKIYLDESFWNYSRTTAKYRNQFLMENTEDTKKKIKSGEYILTDLNC